MSGHRFCTELCRERGEPLAGTGDAPQRILMLAWPRGRWRAPRWESVGMSQELSATLHAAANSGLHVALVDKTEAPGTLPTLHALPEGIAADFSDEGALVAAIRNYMDGILFDGRHDKRPVVLCCTDSRRDACCARHGFSTYKGLVAASDPARLHIVQATHLGGCRFAASLIVMPHRQRYGRMTAEHARDFVAALERGEIYLPAYKGRTDQTEAMQVAELAAMTWAESQGMDARAVALDSIAPPSEVFEGATLVVGARVGGAKLAIQLYAESFHVQGNCSIVASGGGGATMRWCLSGVQAAIGDRD